jgi:Rieske Fe-S protein
LTGVGSPAQAGWTGKLIGAAIGSQFSAPNIAGATPPPKDPSQQDDPIHVQPVGGSSQPQGTTTALWSGPPVFLSKRMKRVVGAHLCFYGQP